MSIVGIKKLLFPSQNARPGLRQHRHDSAAPLLPTSEPTSPRRQSSQYAAKCTRPDCPGTQEIPLARRPHCDSSSSSSSTSSSSADDDASSARWLDPRTMSDAILGLSDGLTVPFALTAGLSAFNDTRVVIFGGCAELIAGSISMGLGGWLAGRGEEEFYTTKLSSTRSLVEKEEEGGGDDVRELVYAVFEPYRIPREHVAPLVSALVSDRDDAVEFLMRFKHELPSREGSKRTPLRSALTIALGYFVGGFVPLLPYFLVAKREVMLGLYWSVGVMAVCLFAFGVWKDYAAGERPEGWWGKVRGGLEMMAIGGVAAGASWGIVRALGDG